MVGIMWSYININGECHVAETCTHLVLPVTDITQLKDLYVVELHSNNHVSYFTLFYMSQIIMTHAIPV